MEKAVLLLHGFLSDPGDFTPLLPHLKERYARIEIPVYPGHGADESYHDFTAEGTLALIEDKIWELTASSPSVDVIGFSLGGALSAYLAQRHSVNKLVLLAPANKYFNFYMPFSKIRYLVKNFYAMEKAYFKRDREGVSYYKDKLKTMFSDDFKALKIVREKYMKRYLRKVYQNFKTLIKTANEGTTEINVPCFIAWGRLDQLVPKESVRMMRALCRHENTVLEIYENHSHLMLLSRASEEIVRDILAFLDA
ncbi:MAG TPA: alpha/beta fold hydrolase [Bacilli bacterium]|jgi:carboxylesterase|nr:alpha/beta fold hydrolase [Bacilli bacterium]HPZ28023.1 alpha/beta fold hydrolase [Bacilli bacterium]HQC90159.1 alpha/beta fold hydrolase [Bacilli bacterium]